MKLPHEDTTKHRMQDSHENTARHWKKTAGHYKTLQDIMKQLKTIRKTLEDTKRTTDSGKHRRTLKKEIVYIVWTVGLMCLETPQCSMNSTRAICTL